ncbi:hypothetical protein TSAR_007149, partial [Trichomalopsis sarcophagae]
LYSGIFLGATEHTASVRKAADNKGANFSGLSHAPTDSQPAASWRSIYIDLHQHQPPVLEIPVGQHPEAYMHAVRLE